MKAVIAYGILTLVAVIGSLPLIYWIQPNTDAGTTLLVFIVLLVTNVVGSLLRRFRSSTSKSRRPTDY